MRRRPWILVVLAVLHFLAPVGNIIFNAMILKQDIFKYFLNALSPQYIITNWAIVFAPIVAGIAIWACKRWSFYVYILAILTLFVFSISSYMDKADYIGIVPMILMFVVNVSIVTYFLIPAVRNIYFDRRLRWWEIQARYSCQLKCQWKLDKEGAGQNGVVGNFSENGLFLKSDVHPQDQEKVKITISMSDGMSFKFAGEAVVHERIDSLGFGIKFEHTSESRKNAQAIVEDLKAKGLRITQNDVRPEDSFTFWVRTLLSTGKGFLPVKNGKNS